MDVLRVLIVDDDPISRRVLQQLVTQAGHTCYTASDGVEAREVFQREEVDLLLTDWMMPGMDGLELCRRVRGDASRDYTYVIVITALDDKAHFLQGMQAGADDYLVKPFDADELRARLLAATRVMRLHRQLEAQNAELTQLNRALAESARTDPLTGLGNRLRLWEDLDVVRSQVERYRYQCALAMCDVDHFKNYNDLYGHLKGDDALHTIARTLASECRSGDRPYRYGGEEFLILLPGQDRHGASLAMRRILRAVERLQIPHQGNPPYEVLTVSGGITALTPGVAQTVEELIAEADQALYRAKAAGRNRVEMALPGASD